MKTLNKRAPFLSFIGDIFILYISLWATLLIRYQQVPEDELLSAHLIPFSFLFIVWLLVFLIAGLYEKRSLIVRKRLPSIILRTQIINSVIAVLFFYFIPYFGITPKTNLFIYLIVSFAAISIWRIWGTMLFGAAKTQHALLIAHGEEMHELFNEVNAHGRYNLRFRASYDISEKDPALIARDIVEKVKAEDIDLIVLDFKQEGAKPLMQALYNLMFLNVVFVDMHEIYEDVFNRIPLSLISYSWFLEHISLAPKVTYDFLKRVMDILIAFPTALVSLIVYPFVIIAIKMSDKGPIFFKTERIGKNGKIIKLLKFRTMTTTGAGIYDAEGKTQNTVTQVGAFLRKTRLDELPQLWNVMKGDISLIGPRPELPSLVAMYEKEISYYGIRHTIKPGLSGWAQIYHDNHPHHGLGVEETKEKLSYDLYYLKNRSFLLDIIIALKTINKLLSIAGK